MLPILRVRRMRRTGGPSGAPWTEGEQAMPAQKEANKK
jgi:hypothetical protein